MLFEEVGFDDGVGDSGFVFDAEEEKTLCGSGALAADDTAG